jgi:pyruvate formate lyase activating enzyme
MMGKTVTAGEILNEVERDLPFYKNTGGGMTVSGGDPTLQPGFTSALLHGAKERGIHTAMETAGFAEWAVFERLLPDLDLVLYDSKQMDPVKHKEYTGQSNEKIHENLRRLCAAEQTVEVVVRTPVIPGYNDDRENFYALAAFLHTLDRLPRVEVLPYNPLAGSKHPRLGMTYELDTDESKGTAPDELCQILKDAGIEARVLR